MGLLHPPRVSTDRFHYDAATGTFMADASDLSDLRLGRVYDDACDEGLTLVSATTGTELVYAVHQEHRDREGELLFTELRPAPGQTSHRFRMAIYND